MSRDDAEHVPLSVQQHDEVGVLGVRPVDALRAQPDQAVNLGVEVGRLPVDPQVEVRAVAVVQRMRTP